MSLFILDAAFRKNYLCNSVTYQVNFFIVFERLTLLFSCCFMISIPLVCQFGAAFICGSIGIRSLSLVTFLFSLIYEISRENTCLLVYINLKARLRGNSRGRLKFRTLGKDFNVYCIRASIGRSFMRYVIISDIRNTHCELFK